jgi:hypothetical protein
MTINCYPLREKSSRLEPIRITGLFRNTNDSGFRTAFLMIVFPDKLAFVIILIAGFLAIVTASSAIVKTSAWQTRVPKENLA